MAWSVTTFSGPVFVVVEREVCLVHLYERRNLASSLGERKVPG